MKSAAGRAILIFCLNLSLILQPRDWVAAIVVSEINDRLSPNMAPPNKAPHIIGRETLPASAKPTTIGAKATIEPTEVPVDMDKKEAIMKIPK